MPEIDEIRLNNLEIRITEKETKEQQWKTNIGKELEGLDEHLRRQDNKMERGKWGDYGAIGVAIVLVALSLWIADGDLSLAALFSKEQGFLFVVGFLMLIGAWFKQRKIKD